MNRCMCNLIGKKQEIPYSLKTHFPHTHASKTLIDLYQVLVWSFNLLGLLAFYQAE